MRDAGARHIPIADNWASHGCRRGLATVYSTQTDPIGLSGGINLYGYAAGDPVNLRDPFGLDPLPNEIKGKLWGACMFIDCDDIDVRIGGCALGRSQSHGNSICLRQEDACRLDVLAAEVWHTVQYFDLGAADYYARGLHDQIRYGLSRRGIGRNPYTDGDVSFLEYQAHSYGNQFKDQSTQLEGCQ